MNKNRQLDDVIEGLRDTLESLPDDGRERRVEIQVGPYNSGNVAGGNQYIVKLGADEPTRAEASRICPQCHRATWRHTQNCIHCALDLFAHDHAVWLDGVRRRAQRSMFFFVVFGFGALIGSQLLPRDLAGWGALMGFASLFMGVVSGRQAEQASK